VLFCEATLVRRPSPAVLFPFASKRSANVKMGKTTPMENGKIRGFKIEETADAYRSGDTYGTAEFKNKVYKSHRRIAAEILDKDQ
jgi:hypothetical protein